MLNTPRAIAARLACLAWLAGCVVNPVPTPSAPASAGGGVATAADAQADGQRAFSDDAAAGLDVAAAVDGGETTTGASDADAAAADGLDTLTAADVPAKEAWEPLPVDDTLPPNGKADLLPWLKAGKYAGWVAESKPHPSTGPHFGKVRTFVNAALLQSLQAGNATHPWESAAVKELYGDGTTVLGYSVMRKTLPGEGGKQWRWFEDYAGKTYADGQGSTLCTGCHSAGKDHFLSMFPLQ